MKTEISAGGIIVRKSGASWDVLLIKDRNGQWTFPKGKIEKGESRVTAARREILEEVGLDGLDLIGRLPKLTYIYTLNGPVDKSVFFFAFRYDGTKKATAQQEEGLSDATWTPIGTAIEIIGYPDSNRPLLLKTEEMLRRL